MVEEGKACLRQLGLLPCMRARRTANLDLDPLFALETFIATHRTAHNTTLQSLPNHAELRTSSLELPPGMRDGEAVIASSTTTTSSSCQ